MSPWKKTFAIIWAGQFFSTLSSAVVGYAVMFWLSLKTGSAEVLAFSGIASLLPQFALGPFTGVLIDRWDRKRIMIGADAFVALCTAVLAVLFVLGKARLGHIYALLALRSLGAAFHWPAMQATLPLLVPEAALLRVAGANQVLNSIATILGPALAAGIMWAVYSGAFTVVMQTTIDPVALGRAYSIFGSVVSAPALIGLLQTGFVADRIGIPNAFIIAGSAFIPIGAVSFFVRPIRAMIRGAAQSQA